MADTEAVGNEELAPLVEPPRPQRDAFLAAEKSLNDEIDSLKAKRERVQATINNTKGSNDEINVSSRPISLLRRVEDRSTSPCWPRSTLLARSYWLRNC